MATTQAGTDASGAGELHPQGAAAYDLKEVLARIERDLILAALQESHGNKARAARALGITQRFMGLRVKRLGIDWRGLRPRSNKSA